MNIHDYPNVVHMLDALAVEEGVQYSELYAMAQALIAAEQPDMAALERTAAYAWATESCFKGVPIADVIVGGSAGISDLTLQQPQSDELNALVTFLDIVFNYGEE